MWHHPALGWIDLVWGNQRGGLAHIISKHAERQKDLTLADLAEMIPHMKVVANDGHTADLESATHKAAVRLDYDEASKRWLVTAFEKKPPTGGYPFVPGSPQTPEGSGHPPPDGSVPLSPEGGSGTPGTSIAPDDGHGNRGSAGGPVYMGTGLGALEPLFREAKAEGNALKKRRDEALAAAKKAEFTPGEKKAGEKIRAYFTAERDLWAARRAGDINNQDLSRGPSLGDGRCGGAVARAVFGAARASALIS